MRLDGTRTWRCTPLKCWRRIFFPCRISCQCCVSYFPDLVLVHRPHAEAEVEAGNVEEEGEEEEVVVEEEEEEAVARGQKGHTAMTAEGHGAVKGVAAFR